MRSLRLTAALGCLSNDLTVRVLNTAPGLRERVHNMACRATVPDAERVAWRHQDLLQPVGRFHTK